MYQVLSPYLSLKKKKTQGLATVGARSLCWHPSDCEFCILWNFLCLYVASVGLYLL